MSRIISTRAGYEWDVDQTQHVLYRGNDDHVHELWFHPHSGWHHGDLTAATGDFADTAWPPVGYTWDVDGTQHVVFKVRGGHLREYWFAPGSGWQQTTLALDLGGYVPMGYAWDVDRTQHVVYKSERNDHVVELWFHRASGWHRSDLTAATGASACAGDPYGYTWDADQTQHVVYRGRDDHIHELWFHFHSGWRHTDLTLAGGGPDVDTNGTSPVGYACPGDGAQHVFYAVEGHIHELRFAPDTGWRDRDISAATGAARAGGYMKRFPAHVWDVDGSQHVVYRGNDGHVHELTAQCGKDWRHVDLTDLTAAPNVSGSGSEPAAWSYSLDRTRHVVFVGDDGELHELWFHRASGWHHEVITKLANAPA